MQGIADRIGQKVENFPLVQSEPVRRFISVGYDLAQRLDAFRLLGLTTEDEKHLLARRFAIALFYTFFAENPWPHPFQREERFGAKNYNVVSSFAEQYTEPESEFQEGESPSARCIKRAIDYAAVECVAVLASDLDHLGQRHVFRSDLLQYGFLDYSTVLFRYSPTIHALGEVPHVKGFRQVFDHFGKKIAEFRTRLQEETDAA